MASKQLKVTAPLVVLKVSDGTYRHLYDGVPVPEDADADHVKQLRKLGMLGEVEAPKSEPDGADRTPTKSSSKADWVTYATDEARGDDRLSAEDAEALTRDDLAAKYLGQS